MSKSFLKFKRKVRVQSILSAVLLGLGTGITAFAVITAVMKLLDREVTPLYYGICIGGAFIVATVLYFLFMPSDKRLAKRLDITYTLDEKVSTMVELREQTDGFAILQREDADRRLGEMPKRALRSRTLIAGILVLAMSLALTVGALLIPAKAETPEAPIDEFDKQWLITAIGELITAVENSYVEEDLKESTLAELKDLLSFVEGSQFLSEMKREAVKTVIAINSALRKANSVEAISEQFAKSSDAELVKLGKELAALSGSGSKKALEALGDKISDLDPSDAVFIADEIDAYLGMSGVRSDDGVYMMFKSLVAAVKSSSSNADDKFDAEAKNLSSAVILQNVNRTTIDTVINKLCSLFGITEEDITAEDPDADIALRDPADHEQVPDEGTEGEEPDTNIGSGGLGTGEIIYGSDDLVFDPDTNTYRPYGEIINEYFAKINEYVTDGKTSEEISAAIDEYFGALFGGLKNDE